MYEPCSFPLFFSSASTVSFHTRTHLDILHVQTLHGDIRYSGLIQIGQKCCVNMGCHVAKSSQFQEFQKKHGRTNRKEWKDIKQNSIVPNSLICTTGRIKLESVVKNSSLSNPYELREIYCKSEIFLLSMEPRTKIT